MTLPSDRRQPSLASDAEAAKRYFGSFGYHWTSIALRARVRHGDTVYYMHPWEFARRPQTEGHWLRNRIFLRRMGPWMDRTLGRILDTFDGRIATVGSVAARYTAPAAAATAAAS